MRFERKYQLDYFTYQRVKATMSGRVFADAYTRHATGGRYFVRSLYFDTHDFQAYQETVVGQSSRIKLRLRTYNEVPSSDFTVKLELKCRYSARVGKFSAVVSSKDYREFLSRQRWRQELGQEADEFRRLVLLRGLRPKLLVDYRREAYIPYQHRDMRITFDHQLKFASADRLFPSSRHQYSPHPKQVVLEIKSEGEVPGWLDMLVRQHGLKSVPNSKYARAVEQTQAGVFRRG